MTELSPALLVLTHDGSWEGRFQVSSLAASTAATGEAVAIGLFFDALAAWVEERWDVEDPKSPRLRASRALAAYPPLSSLLGPGREAGRVRLLACSASVRLLGLDSHRVQATVDAIVGWPTFARLVSVTGRIVTFG
jgi:predicted peroxiredoxin